MIVRIYTKEGCPHCEAALRYLDQEGIQYRQIDVHQVSGAQEEVMKLSGGACQVPVIVRDGEVEIGYRGGS
ncbi:MAG: glutaredoxin family protein [candidate division Zixibacteria bacterium]|nr:glutaredoxin family protein [candidate division Zixibacteria bacterium]